ncbi:unnamed protein product, partial [Rotaria sp. Silwood1]
VCLRTVPTLPLSLNQPIKSPLFDDLVVTEQRFEEEIRRVESYLHPSTLAPLMKNLERVLIHEQLEAIYTQAKALLHDENYSGI